MNRKSDTGMNGGKHFESGGRIRTIAGKGGVKRSGMLAALMKTPRATKNQAGNLYYIARSLQIRGGIGRVHVNASLGTRENIVV